MGGTERDTHAHNRMSVRISARTTKPEDLHVEGGISLAECLVLLLVVFKDSLEVSYALIFPLPISSLRGTVLGSPSLLAVRRACGLVRLLEMDNSYREDRGWRVLVPILTLPLWRGLVSQSRLGRRLGGCLFIILFYR